MFAYGFRTFFLAAAASALVLVTWWTAVVIGGLPMTARWPGSLWHGHEMLHGLVVAAIAGFLLTAVPSWTGRRGFGGAPLVVMFAVWLAGRVACVANGPLPALLVAAIDLAFLPVLAGWIAPPLIRARNRNTPLLAVLGALWAAAFAVFLVQYGPILWRPRPDGRAG